MIIINNKKYKLVYLDTNALSEFVNNTNGFSKNLLLKIIDGNHRLVTSVFNIIELNKTQNDFKEKMKASLGILPLGILTNIEQVCEYEKKQISVGNDIIMFAVGISPLLNVSIDDLFNFLNESTTKALEQQRMSKLEKELAEWKKQRCSQNAKWQSDFNNVLTTTMASIVMSFPNSFLPEQLKLCHSLQICSYIRNMFIHNSSKPLEINSVIDSYNAAYFPYVEVYITEKTVGAWLENSKNKFSFVKEKIIYKISDFYNK